MTALKQFLKPDWRKIVITSSGIIILIIIILSNNVFECGMYPCAYFSDYFGFGLPGGGSCCSHASDMLLNFSAFIITLIVFYFVSCIAIWLHYKKILRNWGWIVTVIIMLFIVLYLFIVYIASFIQIP